jgi:hypothetical protein
VRTAVKTKADLNVESGVFRSPSPTISASPTCADPQEVADAQAAQLAGTAL